MDLSGLSSQDLRALQEQVSQEIKRQSQAEITKAREQIMAIAESVGLPLRELLAKQRAKSGPVAALYQNPSDVSQQWSGRGRQPQWVKDLLATDKDLNTAKI